MVKDCWGLEGVKDRKKMLGNKGYQWRHSHAQLHKVFKEGETIFWIYGG